VPTVALFLIGGAVALKQIQKDRAQFILDSAVTLQDPAVAALLALEIDGLWLSKSKESLEALRFAHDAAASALPARIFRGHGKAVYSVAFSRDGSRFITASEDNTARIWNTDGSGEAIILHHGERVVSAAFSPDGNRVVTSSDGFVRVWTLNGENKPVTFPEQKRSAMAVAFSSDGSSVLTVSTHGTLRTWSLDGSLLQEIDNADSSEESKV